MTLTKAKINFSLAVFSLISTTINPLLYHAFSLLFSSFLYSTRGLLYIQWYVSTISKDIADFYLHFRDDKNKILLEKILAYDTRFANVSGTELAAIEFQQNVELCVLARNSDYTIVNTEDNQCTRMPQNFNSVMKKYNKRPSTIFKVFVMDKNHLGRNTIIHESSGAKGNFACLIIVSVAAILTIMM